MRAILAVLLLCVVTSAQARDDGTYAMRDPALHAWFDKLASKKGLCCSFADGRTINDPDWGTDGDHYWVRVDGQTIAVPDEAVVTEPNRFNVPIVWPWQTDTYNADGSPGKPEIHIRCFLPAALY